MPLTSQQAWAKVLPMSEDQLSPVPTESAPPATPEAVPEATTGPAGDESSATPQLPAQPERLLTEDQIPLTQVIEALLFSTDVPLTAGKLGEVCGLDSTKPIRQAVEELNQGYQARSAAFRIEERAGGYQLLTLAQYSGYIERLVRKRDEGRLTPAQLETLAIVAYKQPLTRVGVEAIRGVACGDVLRALMEHNMVKIVGRAEDIGRPLLYGTTRYFLEVFGLANIKDLPKSDQLPAP